MSAVLPQSPAAWPRFGTDGVRAVANGPISPEFVLALGRSAARVLDTDRFVVGRDTRRSGTLVESALCAGLTSAGVNVVSLGVCPTPAVAWTAHRDGVAGAMISASHNPFPDNGIKLFAPGGAKLSDATQHELEAVLGAADQVERPTGAAVGVVHADPTIVAAYGASVAASIDGRRLDGVHVVLDTANGAAHVIGPATLRSLGARVDVIADRPDGLNINQDCGSTHLDAVAARVQEVGADLGVALDGDADRVLAVDRHGALIDGDQIIGMCAIDLRDRGLLADSTVVVTVMANLGFRLGMERHGIRVHETAVGDRYVLESLEESNWSLGGEQSGHVIFRELASTGDGLLTAVQVLDLVVRSGRSIRELADGAMTKLPQVLENVRLDDRNADRRSVLKGLQSTIGAVEAELGERGRVLIRPSGTEPLVRVMVEAEERTTAQAAADRLVEAVRVAAR